MKLSDGTARQVEDDSVRYVCRTDVVPNSIGIKKAQRAVQSFTEWPARVLVASTECMRISLLRKTGAVLTLCNQSSINQIVRQSGPQKMNVSRVKIEEGDVIIYSLHPNLPRQAKRLYVSMIDDWASDLTRQEVDWIL